MPKQDVSDFRFVITSTRQSVARQFDAVELVAVLSRTENPTLTDTDIDALMTLEVGHCHTQLALDLGEPVDFFVQRIK